MSNLMKFDDTTLAFYCDLSPAALDCLKTETLMALYFWSVTFYANNDMDSAMAATANSKLFDLRVLLAGRGVAL
jgi:hypothetical protein